MQKPAPAAAKAAGSELYTDGSYLEKNALWHAEESPFKVKQILRMLKQNGLRPQTICEVGTGSGEALKLLQAEMDGTCRCWGYDISPQAMEICRGKENDRLQFKLADVSQEEDAFFDLLLILDVVEHIEDYYGFLRGIRPKGDLKIFHFPLDLSVQAVMRKRGLLTRREAFGHIQYFTKETALATLEELGYEVVDHFYTPRSIDMAKQLIQKIFVLPRRLGFAIDPDLTVRVLGGYSLLVLAR